MSAAFLVDALNMADWTRRHTSLEGLVASLTSGVNNIFIACTKRLADVGATSPVGTASDNFDIQT